MYTYTHIHNTIRTYKRGACSRGGLPPRAVSLPWWVGPPFCPCRAVLYCHSIHFSSWPGPLCFPSWPHEKLTAPFVIADVAAANFPEIGNRSRAGILGHRKNYSFSINAFWLSCKWPLDDRNSSFCLWKGQPPPPNYCTPSTDCLDIRSGNKSPRRGRTLLESNFCTLVFNMPFLLKRTTFIWPPKSYLFWVRQH